MSFNLLPNVIILLSPLDASKGVVNETKVSFARLCPTHTLVVIIKLVFRLCSCPDTHSFIFSKSVIMQAYMHLIFTVTTLFTTSSAFSFYRQRHPYIFRQLTPPAFYNRLLSVVDTVCLIWKFWLARWQKIGAHLLCVIMMDCYLREIVMSSHLHNSLSMFSAAFFPSIWVINDAEVVCPFV